MTTPMPSRPRTLDAPLPARDRGITRTERKYLEALQHLSTPEHPAYLFSLPKGRWGLLALTPGFHYDVQSRHNKNDATIGALRAAGLIEVGRGEALPAPFETGFGYPTQLSKLGVEEISAPPMRSRSPIGGTP